MASPVDARATTRLHDSLVEGYSRRWSELERRWARRPAGVLGTLGPAGTSSHLTADFLAGEYGLRVRLFDSFDLIRPALLAGSVDAMLVPSAFSGLTTFHWDSDLQLLGFFARPTPEYGIAFCTQPPAPAGPLRVAAMWEVRPVYDDLVPLSLRDREPVWVDAGSTQEAAEILAAGGSDLAVTNGPGAARHGLRWLARRPGADIIWTVFGPRDRVPEKPCAPEKP